MPVVVAHRGLSARYPENTLAGIRAAIDAGVRYVEFDIQLSADGIPFLHHDRTLHRTAGRPEEIADLPAAALRKIAVGEADRFGSRFAAEKLPSLHDCVALLARHPDVHAFVEIKRISLRQFGHERVVDAVLPLLAPIASRSSVISFDARVVAMSRERGAASIGWVLKDYDSETKKQASELAPQWLFVNYRKIPPTAGVWEGPWRWVVYEVASAELALQLAKRGVHCVESMLADTLLTDLQTHNGGTA